MIHYMFQEIAVYKYIHIIIGSLINNSIGHMSMFEMCVFMFRGFMNIYRVTFW